MCSVELFDTGSHLASSRPRRKKPKFKSQRICLHEMDHWRCSIIGTCLTP